MAGANQMTQSTAKKAAAQKATKAEATKSHIRIVDTAPKQAAPKQAAPKAFKATKEQQTKKASIELTVIQHSETIALNTKAALQGWIDMGTALIEYRAFYLSTGLGTLTSRANKESNPLGSFLGFWMASDFNFLTENNVSEAIFISENAALVNAEMRKEAHECLNGLSTSHIKKMIKAALDAKNPKKTKAAKEKAAKLKADNKAAKIAKEKAKGQIVNFTELMKCPVNFGKIIGQLLVKEYTVENQEAFFEATQAAIDATHSKK